MIAVIVAMRSENLVKPSVGQRMLDGARESLFSTVRLKLRTKTFRIVLSENEITLKTQVLVDGIIEREINGMHFHLQLFNNAQNE